MFDHVLRGNGAVEQVRSSTSVAEPRFAPLIGGGGEWLHHAADEDEDVSSGIFSGGYSSLWHDRL
jgi:hypothetical protein